MISELLGNLPDNTWVVAISVFISALVSKWFNIRTESKYQKELETQKQLNAISKDTYQKLFETKINIYNELVTAYETYDTVVRTSVKMSYDPSGGTNNYDWQFFELSKNIKELIKPNLLLVSPEVAEGYRDLFSVQEAYFLEMNKLSENHPDVSPEEFRAVKEDMRRATESCALKLYEYIKRDVDQLRDTFQPEI
jgi:hypothetical protein